MPTDPIDQAIFDRMKRELVAAGLDDGRARAFLLGVKCAVVAAGMNADQIRQVQKGAVRECLRFRDLPKATTLGGPR